MGGAFSSSGGVVKKKKITKTTVEQDMFVGLNFRYELRKHIFVVLYVIAATFRIITTQAARLEK